MKQTRQTQGFFEQAVQKVFGRKFEEGTGNWRYLHIKELPNLCSSSHMNRLIKPRRMWWVVHEARM